MHWLVKFLIVYASLVVLGCGAVWLLFRIDRSKYDERFKNRSPEPPDRASLPKVKAGKHK